MPHVDSFVGDVLVPSVTQITGIKPKPFLLPWAAARGNKKAEALREALGLTREEAVARIPDKWFKKEKWTREEFWLSHTELKERGGDSGSNFHAMVENYLRHGNEKEAHDLFRCEEDEGMFKSWLEWWQTQGYEVVDLEMHLVADYVLMVHGEEVRLPFGGSFDALVSREGKKSLLDWKTSNSVDDGWGAQLGGYAGLLFLNTGEWPDDGAAVHIPKKAPYKCKPHPYEDLKRLFYQGFVPLRWAYDYCFSKGQWAEEEATAAA